MGVAGTPSPPVALGAVRLETSALPEDAAAALREVVGQQGVRVDHSERVLHAAGKGYPDLVRLRAGPRRGTRCGTASARSRAGTSTA